MMIIFFVLLVGLLIGGADFLLFKEKSNFKDFALRFIKSTILVNIFTFAIMKFGLKVLNVFSLSLHGPIYWLKYTMLALAVGAIILAVKGILGRKITFEKAEKKSNKKRIIGRISVLIVFILGAAIYFGSSWGANYFGDVTPDQLIVNLKTPIAGTSEGIVAGIFEGPVFSAAVVVAVFSIFLFPAYDIVYNNKEKCKAILNQKFKTILCLVLALVTLGGSISYGIKSLRLVEVYNAYMTDSPYIQNNYVDPRNVKMSFPKEKRNLIHIYLESIENSYLSKELGGHMEQNLMPELTELSKEGINFSHNDTFGGPYQTSGSGWSVASMINMEMGIPLKIPTNGNSYGKNGKFLPGAINIGDILSAQGYEQTLMFGSDSDFGGLTAYFTSHGNYNIIDYKAALKKGLIPKGYKVWWGYEDAKLFEFAKDELTRLSQTGKPFHFNMETVDTHFPDGYITDDVPKKYESQYANVIAHSSTKTVEFIRWIQKQDFYENTTIVITGDHWSMDKKFFENFDPEYRRSIFNLILNPAITTDKNHNRGYAPFDMFPTMLASMGVEIEGEKLGLGTNLFSGEPTLVERDGMFQIETEIIEKSYFYNDELLSNKKEHKFENTNVTYR